MPYRVITKLSAWALVLILACLAGVSGASCSSAGPPSTSSPEPTPTPSFLAPGTCPVTVPRTLATPPPQLGIRPTDVPPVPYVEDWYGNSVLWVMLPPGGVLPAYPQPVRLATKFPWFRVEPGALEVTGQRLDGPTGAFSASSGDTYSYGATGFDPSFLMWSSPGCWRVTGTVAGKGSLTITMRVEAPPP